MDEIVSYDVIFNEQNIKHINTFISIAFFWSNFICRYVDVLERRL